MKQANEVVKVPGTRHGFREAAKELQAAADFIRQHLPEGVSYSEELHTVEGLAAWFEYAAELEAK